MKMGEISAAGDAPNSSPSTIEEDARNSTSETRKPPLIALAMIKSAIGKESISSLKIDELSDRAYGGVLLKDEAENGENQIVRPAIKLKLHDMQKSANQDLSQMIKRPDRSSGRPYARKYWVHEKLNKNCWMVLARALSIVGVDNKDYWKWPEEEESCYGDNKNVDIAELRRIWWLEISGKLNTIMLSPWTTYEVEILVKMRSRSSGWQVPVNLSLVLPDGNKQGRTERLDILKKEKWIPISIGKFETTPKNVGSLSFSLTQTDGEKKKTGLCIKAVEFKPTT